MSHWAGKQQELRLSISIKATENCSHHRHVLCQGLVTHLHQRKQGSVRNLSNGLHKILTATSFTPSHAMFPLVYLEMLILSIARVLPLIKSALRTC
jgi:hypothetical protein